MASDWGDHSKAIYVCTSVTHTKIAILLCSTPIQNVKENVRRTGHVITALYKCVGDRVLPSRREKEKGLGTAGLDNKALTEQKSPRFVEVTELECND